MAHAMKGLMSKFNKNVMKIGKEKKVDPQECSADEHQEEHIDDKNIQTQEYAMNERQEECIEVFGASLVLGSPCIQDDANVIVGAETESESEAPFRRFVTALDDLKLSDCRNPEVHEDQPLSSPTTSSVHEPLSSPTTSSVHVQEGDTIVHPNGKQETYFQGKRISVETLQQDNVSEEPLASETKNKDHETKLRHRVSNIFQGVRKPKGSRASRDCGVSSSITSPLNEAQGKEISVDTIPQEGVSEEPPSPETSKSKEIEVNLRRRVSDMFQGVRKNRFSRSSRDSGVASSISDTLDLEWIGDDDSDWENDVSDDSDFDDDFYEDFEERVSWLEVEDKQTEDMPCKIALFMLQTEREYVQQLTQLVKVLSGLADVARKHKGSDNEGVLKKLAKSAGAILKFHDDFFLPGLKTRLAEWKSSRQLGDLMTVNAPFFKLYRDYTQQFEHAVPVIGTWKRDPKKFSSLIKDIKKLPECDNVPFQDFMWFPIKRLQAMQFFLAAYLKNIPEDAEETNDMKEALELLCEAKEYPQKSTRKRSMHKVKHDIRQIKRSLTPPPPITEEEPIVEPPTEVNPEDLIVPKDKVQRIVLELLTTERSYVRKLRLLQTIEERFRKENTLSDEIIKEIFSKLESILLFHAEHLLPQIEERAVNWETNKRIGDVLKKNAPFLKIYAEYIQNYENAKHQIETWKKKSSKFASALVEIRESPESSGVPLDGHLLEPVQRVPRYELLIKEYLKSIPEACEDRNDAEEALKLVKEAASHSNQFLKKMDKFKKTYDVYQSLKGTKFDFSVPDRELLKDGFITFITPGTCEKQRKVIYLFSDVIILCSESLFGKFNISSQIELSDLKISKGKNPVVPDTFIVMGTSTTVELQNTEDGDTDWYKEITNVLQEMVNRRMSSVSDSEGPTSPSNADDQVLSCPAEISKEEIGKRAPRLKPFQTAHKCMRCRTKFTSTMTKYNCKGCGFVICSKCSRQSKMEYKNMKLSRACYECFMLLRDDSTSEDSDDDSLFRSYVKEDNSSPDATWKGDNSTSDPNLKEDNPISNPFFEEDNPNEEDILKKDD